MSVLNRDWSATEIDPSFAGSLWERLGFSDHLCPTCHSHVMRGFGVGGFFCLNACHLSAASQARFAGMMREAGERVKAHDPLITREEARMLLQDRRDSPIPMDWEPGDDE